MLDKLPVLGTKNQRVMLQRNMLKILTDTEFSILWYMPGLDIIISPATQDYIDKRRRALGLKFKVYAGYDLKNEEGIK